VEFFNDKEEVMDLQLTPYGVDLLRRGEFSPVFYACFDDDVLYDGTKAGLDGFGEVQNDIEDRIVNGTARMRVQRRFDSSESAVNSSQDNPYADTEVASHVLPLGRMGTFSANDQVPLWMARLLHGTMESVVSEVDAMPQLEVDMVQYLIQVHEKEEEGNESRVFDETKHEFSDGSFATVVGDYILFDVEEIAAEFGRDNFELELFEVEPSGKLLPLYFFREPEIVKDNILLEKPIEFDEGKKQSDPSLVEYFFDVLVDYDVDDKILCEHTTEKNNKDNIYLSDDGLIATEQAGKVCENTEDGVSIVNQYSIRKEGDLGDQC
jgi:hypothetical protein